MLRVNLYKISIITPTLNREKYLSQAIESVQAQNYSPVEHIVVDGGSTDGTTELVAKYPNTILFHESEQGLYAALNKGIQICSGEIIGLLNSDDYYDTGVFSLVSESFIGRPEVMAVLGGSQVFRDGEVERKTQIIYPPYPEEKFIDSVVFGVPMINAWFFRREVFRRFGLFDLRYQLAADRDFMIRLALERIPYTTVMRNFMNYRQHPDSLTFEGSYRTASRMLTENCRVARNRLAEAKSEYEQKLFSSWHRQLSIDHALMALQVRDLRTAVQCAHEGTRLDAAWINSFLLALIRGGWKRIRLRLFRPRSEPDEPTAS